MTSTTKIWILRGFLLVLCFFTFIVAIEDKGSVPLAVTVGGLIYSFFKNPFENTKNWPKINKMLKNTEGGIKSDTTEKERISEQCTQRQLAAKGSTQKPTQAASMRECARYG